jgi:hypothetical protein
MPFNDSVRVDLAVHLPEERRERFERCRQFFENYCVVESIRHGIPVSVAVAIS